MPGLLGRLKVAFRNLLLDDFKGYREITSGSIAGPYVDQYSALGVSAYWNGVLVIAQSIGVLDRFLYRRLDEDERERATAHPAYRVIHDQPNPYTTPQVFWETIAFHAVSWGNGYAEIEWDNSLRPRALWLITPDKMEPRVDSYTDKAGRKTSTLWYQYNGNQRINPEDVIHVPGLGYDGIRGYSVVQLAKQSLGLTMAAEQFGAAFFGNGAWNGMHLEHPGKLSDPGYERVKKSMEENTGARKAHKPLILEEGMKVSRPLMIPPDDAQFLETRMFQIEEIARWLNLPPHKLKHKMGERPGGNLEASQIDYLTDTLLPWTTRIEQELNRKLISESQRSTYFVEHLYQKILRADVTTRMASYKSLFEMGVVDAEWIAKTENLPKPKPSEAAPALPQAPDPDEPDAKMESSLRAVASEAMGRYVRRESARVRQAVKRGPAGFQPWLEDFYGREAEVLVEFIEPAVGLRLALLRSTTDPTVVARVLAKGYIARSKDELLDLPAQFTEQHANALMSIWEATRPKEMTDAIAALEAQEEGHAA